MTYSIIIPTYNSAKVIKRCLDSIIAQTYKDYEVLVMDGVSKDGTLEIVNSYKDKRIKLCSEPDKGIYDAMNKGIDKANGDWLLFLGSDDYLLNKDVLKDVARYLDAHFHVIYGDCNSNRLNPEHCGEWTINHLSFNRCHQGIFYSKRFWATGIRYNMKYKLLADYDINLKWFLDTKHFRSKNIPVNVSFFSAGGLSDVLHDEIFYNDYGSILMRYGKDSLTPKYKKRAIRLMINNLSKCNPKRCVYHILIVHYYVLQKLQELVHINQEKLNE